MRSKLDVITHDIECACLGYGGAYFSPPWLYMLSIQLDNAGMREPGNNLARDEGAWAQLYDRTLDIVNQKLREKGLEEIEAITS